MNNAFWIEVVDSVKKNRIFMRAKDVVQVYRQEPVGIWDNPRIINSIFIKNLTYYSNNINKI